MAFDVAAIHLAEPGPFMPPSFELGIEDTAIPPGGRFFASFATIFRSIASERIVEILKGLFPGCRPFTPRPTLHTYPILQFGVGSST
jgi:hypothetical protein